jgi:hypothetical protein
MSKRLTPLPTHFFRRTANHIYYTLHMLIRDNIWSWKKKFWLKTEITSILMMSLLTSREIQFDFNEETCRYLTSNVLAAVEVQDNILTYHMEIKLNLVSLCLQNRILLMSNTWNTRWVNCIQFLIEIYTLVDISFCHVHHCNCAIRVNPNL